MISAINHGSNSPKKMAKKKPAALPQRVSGLLAN
jgi:hypothetical protein